MEHPDQPGVQCCHLIKKGELVGGRWSRSPHCVDDLDDSNELDDKDEEKRYAIVMYGEYRMLEKDTYLHVENANTQNVRNPENVEANLSL